MKDLLLSSENFLSRMNYVCTGGDANFFCHLKLSTTEKEIMKPIFCYAYYEANIVWSFCLCRNNFTVPYFDVWDLIV